MNFIPNPTSFSFRNKKKQSTIMTSQKPDLLRPGDLEKNWVVNKPEGFDTFGWSLRLAIMHDLGLAPSKRFFCEPLWLHPSPDISVISTSLSKFRSTRLVRNSILFAFPSFGWTINNSFEWMNDEGQIIDPLNGDGFSSLSQRLNRSSRLCLVRWMTFWKLRKGAKHYQWLRP